MTRTVAKNDIVSPAWPRRLTWIALGLALALVIARGTMQEYLREPFEVLPGSEAAPRAPGPAASLGLDLLCCVPALLVLLRAVVDRRFMLVRPRSFILLGLLSVWMLLSTLWAADKFAALVTACHWTAAMAMLWAAAQLVRDWVKLRLVAAVAFGMLPVYVIYGLNYRFMELPEVKKTFQQDKAKFFQQHGLQEGTFAAKQFTDKVNLGEMFGFLSSPNSFGALLSLLLVIGAGLVIQRAVEPAEMAAVLQAEGGSRRRRPGSGGRAALESRGPARRPIAPAIPAVIVVMLLGLWILAYTRSRTAMATPVIAAVLLLLTWRFRETMLRRSKALYVTGIAIFVLVLTAVIFRGITRGSLFHSSLTFRWQYWVGSASVFKEHPILGVGWSNFGLYYLAHRLPQAPEEIKDPHSFPIRFFTELGLVGGVLVIAWQLRLWWELTRPVSPVEVGESGPGVVKFVATVAASGVGLSTAMSVDFSMGAPELDAMRRLLWIGAMLIVASLASLRSLDSQEPDGRVAPWILYAMLVAVGVFLIHNLIDFSLFEIGPMFLFAMLAGSALGMRQADGGERRAARGPAIVLAVGCAIWLAAAMLVWGPILQAERAADAADTAIRGKRMAEAEALLDEANRDAWGLNADYAYRAARVAPPEKQAERMGEVIRQNPRDGQSYATRARAELRRTPPDQNHIRSDFEAALRLDPNNVGLRLEYAGVLAQLGDRSRAAEQYESALRYNDLLNWDERKRLEAGAIAEIRDKIRALGE